MKLWVSQCVQGMRVSQPWVEKIQIESPIPVAVLSTRLPLNTATKHWASWYVLCILLTYGCATHIPGTHGDIGDGFYFKGVYN